MPLDLIALVGQPVPPNAAARDIILSALLDGKERHVDQDQERLLAAVPSLIADGLVLADGEKLRLAPGAADAASAARDRMRGARRERAEWGMRMREALRERRLGAGSGGPEDGGPAL